MKETDLAKEIIITFLEKSQTPDALADIYEITSGNNKLLLGHIIALINIFTKAKEQLEGDINEQEC